MPVIRVIHREFDIHKSDLLNIILYRAFPCFRSCGPINCPEDKLPMPRDLWYRIVYSQALDQQLGKRSVV